jgi:hypothetical protein
VDGRAAASSFGLPAGFSIIRLIPEGVNASLQTAAPENSGIFGAKLSLGVFFLPFPVGFFR